MPDNLNNIGGLGGLGGPGGIGGNHKNVGSEGDHFLEHLQDLIGEENINISLPLQSFISQNSKSAAEMQSFLSTQPAFAAHLMENIDALNGIVPSPEFLQDLHTMWDTDSSDEDVIDSFQNALGFLSSNP